jgi:hypothetical protein
MNATDTKVPVPTMLTPEQDLAASHCDRCTAEARVLVARGPARMALCGHHYHQHEDALATGDWKVVADTRPPLH